MRSVYIVLFILGFYQSILAQNTSSNLDHITISILTCRSGDALYSTFGHTGIRVQDTKQKQDVVYNYGLFNPNTDFFYLKFMRGKLPYRIGSASMSNFIAEYNYEKRTVLEQKLNLSNDQKERIINFLLENLRPENREYPYDFFFDNCATRVGNVIETADDNMVYDPVEKITFRQMLKENLTSMKWSEFGIDLVIGAKADGLATRKDQMFLPEYLMTILGNVKISVDGKETDLMQKSQILLDYEEINEVRKRKAINLPLFVTLSIGILFAFMFLRRSKYLIPASKILLLLSGLLGTLLWIMWLATDHQACGNNWNTLWLNPLYIFLLIEPIRKNKVLSYGLLFLLMVSAINCLTQILPQYFLISFLPWIVSIGLSIYALNQHKTIPSV